MGLTNKLVERIITESGYCICHKEVEKKRDAISISIEEINLSERSKKFLENKGFNSLWAHQAKAIKESINGNNVCVTTSTSSGKTEIFLLSAIEMLEKQKNSKILAIYPMKALNRQQLARWEKTGYKIGKIDGDITDPSIREQELSKSDIIVMTPDVMHSFLLGKINDRKIGKSIKEFIKNVSLVIIDELHLYKGLFGTNTAYLFRRFNNIHRLLCKKDCFAQYLTASATLPNAVEHSYNITGVPNFIEIGIKDDASPISEKTFYFIESENDGNLTKLVSSLSAQEGAKSITFVESRQKTGDMANLSIDDEIIEDVKKSGIYPYRSGYEEKTINNITNVLEDGNFKGIISTSALEIGIDIKGLNIVIIADMPQDKNAYQQRIGRAGRAGCDTSFVIIVKNKSFSSQLLFDYFNYDINKVLPNYEPALYLEDKNVQNIHALCHVGDNEECEYLEWKGKENSKRTTFKGKGYFPESFVSLCQDVINDQLSTEYNIISKEAESPHHAYPVRFFGKQYAIKAAIGEDEKNIPEENISREQICTEGYEGAVRNTMLGECNIKERIKRIELSKGEIYAIKERNKYIRTKSYNRTYLVPNFKEDSRNTTMYYGDAKIYNLNVMERRTIYGYYEYKNKSKEYKKYDKPFYLRPLPTTGTIIFNPSFNNKGVSTAQISRIIFEALLKKSALDRNDINYLGGQLYSKYDELNICDKFIAIYDVSTLNITNRIINRNMIEELFSFINTHLFSIVNSIFSDVKEETNYAIKELCNDIINNEAEVSFKDVGPEYSYEFQTKVLYIEKDDETEEVVSEKIGIYLGGGLLPNTANLMINGVGYANIPLENIKPTIDTKFSR